MGNSLTRETIIELAYEMINGTLHSHRLSDLKTKIKTKCVGTKWYQGFIN
jgi:hypothetical protein